MFSSPLWNPLKGSGVIFDWDGVLAETRLDFSGIRERYFGGKRAAILEEMSLMDEEKRRALSEEIRAIELAGAEKAVPVPGSREVVDLVSKAGIPWAVVSRNCPESIELAARTIGFKLPVHTFHRESGPIKPSPEALWMAAEAIGSASSGCTVVGDFVYDLLGARRAGMRAVLVERSSVDWGHWADVFYPRMTDFLSALINEDPIVPWEYHGLVSERGLSWLTSAWNVSIALPELWDEAILNSLMSLAELGVGRFTVKAGTLTFDEWRGLSWLSPKDLERPKAFVLARALKKRYPKVVVEECEEGLPLASLGGDLVNGLERHLS
ncbi:MULTISPECIES: HAD family hydrolase [Dethiosulfovibrio]|jgi:HAD superfamily hydrolase (TIGR01509 family)|uniref:HAD family phosphatase n=2 Tax=Dethiosulfovibrio TaxID=47054 RepID=A0ABS9ENB7_9BACT|nr:MULTISPECIES: HAD family phosphatase [Dethiosulfovibrio]MCF4112839.1 HAD family phosphatase [Dethiosulfovibrio russensis]MCF4141303.1 HAD family phosphatase [Dethiosulfovibrio marinus]MCF4144989.1 HAD family phosphatase [Dethiosulfovibrio acidaminovorans]